MQFASRISISRAAALHPAERRPSSLFRPVIALARKARVAQIHWLECLASLLVIMLLMMQAFRPSLPGTFDPRGLVLPAMEPWIEPFMNVGRAAVNAALAPATLISPAVPAPVAEPDTTNRALIVASEPDRAESQDIAIAPVPADTAEPAALPRVTASAPATPLATEQAAAYAQIQVRRPSNIVIDNRQNGADVYVNLVRLGETAIVAARVVVVPSGSKYTLSNVQRGQYELRYRDLAVDRISRRDAFDMGDPRARDGRTTISIYQRAG